MEIIDRPPDFTIDSVEIKCKANFWVDGGTIRYRYDVWEQRSLQSELKIVGNTIKYRHVDADGWSNWETHDQDNDSKLILDAYNKFIQELLEDTFLKE